MSKGRYLIHVLDTPGFQDKNPEYDEPSTFNDLRMNYTRERLHMLFHESTFTAEQDRCLQENIDWMFSETVVSPLSVIDIVDKHVPQVCHMMWVYLLLACLFSNDSSVWRMVEEGCYGCWMRSPSSQVPMTTHSWNESRTCMGSRTSMVSVCGCDGVLE